VAGQRQRPVHAGRADFQLVLARDQLLAGRLRVVERVGDQPGQVGDGVQVHAAVAVDRDAQLVASADLAYGKVFKVVAGRLEQRGHQVADPFADLGQAGGGRPCDDRGGGRGRAATVTLSHTQTPLGDDRMYADLPRGSDDPQIGQATAGQSLTRGDYRA